jgi:peptidoglycan DL-endopeptidase CwlO
VREQRSTGRNRRWRLGLASGCAAALCLATLPGASADDDDEPFPSRERVRQAQERVTTTADRVDAIEAQLLAADQRLEALSLEAAKAAEAYNGALYKLQQAKIAARRTERTATAAASDLLELEDQLRAAVVSNFENGGPLTNLGILMQESDPDALLEQLDAYHSVTGAMHSELSEYESAKVVADVLRDQAEAALNDQEDATEAAREAKEAVEAAVAAAQSAVSTIAAEKAALVRKLARVQDISIELAQQRQQALADQAAEEAAEEAAQEAAELAAEEEQEEQEGSDPAPTDQDPPNGSDDPAPTDQDPPNGSDDPPSNGSDDPPSGGSDDPPSDGNDNPPSGGDNDPPSGVDKPPSGGNNNPPPSRGARAAIAFAKAQLGEPYVYGADGPNSWDCSGLTMRAWAKAGKSLSHWSVAQYYETTPVSFGDIRRGDLLFWGDSSDPDSIFHVAMYLGRGRMIHAPRPGRSVEIVSLYYWILPNFYTRV